MPLASLLARGATGLASDDTHTLEPLDRVTGPVRVLRLDPGHPDVSAEVAAFSELESLAIDVFDERLAGLVQLRRLEVRRSARLPAIARLPALDELTLAGAVGDLAALAGTPARTIDLRATCGLDDRCLPVLAALPRLEVLFLPHDGAFTDASPLVAARSLVRVDPAGAIDAAAIVRLARGLPSLGPHALRLSLQRWATTPLWDVIARLDTREVHTLLDRVSDPIVAAAALLARLVADRDARGIAQLAEWDVDVGPAMPMLAELSTADAAGACRAAALAGIPLGPARVMLAAVPSEVASAALSIDAAGDPAVVAKLRELCVRWRWGALDAAGRVLERLIGSPDPEIRGIAHKAVRTEDLTEALLVALRDPELRAKACSAIASSRDPRVLDALAALLSTPAAFFAATALSNRAPGVADLPRIRPHLEAALRMPRRPGLDAAATLLCRLLRETGEEPALPGSATWRPIWALSDDALPEQDRPAACAACGSERTVCIHVEFAGSLAGTWTLWEYRCVACGRYFTEERETG